MKNGIIVRTLVLLLWFVFGKIAVLAQENSNSIYKVKFFSDTNILIGRQSAERGCIFNGIETIHWSNSKDIQYLKVLDCKKEDVVYIVYYPDTREIEIKPESELFSENGVSDVELFSESETNGKGWGEDEGGVKFDTIGWLKDTLLIPAPTSLSAVVSVSAIAHFKNDSLVTTISRTKDGTKYIIPRKVIGMHQEPFYLDIIEKSADNWEYFVWWKLHVIPLPLEE